MGQRLVRTDDGRQGCAAFAHLPGRALFLGSRG
jgi:hypothetical protein